MAIHYMENEEEVWSSFPAKSYRLFMLGRDLAFGLALMCVAYLGLFYLGVESLSVLLGGPFIVGVVVSIYAGVHQINLILVKYIITTDRLIFKRGWLNRDISTVPLENIEDTKARQSLFERILNIGTIYVYTANDSNNLEKENGWLNKVPRIADIDKPFERNTEILEYVREKKETYQTQK